MSTKYPIILVHGIVLKDFHAFRAFGKIEKILRDNGHTVFTSQIDGFGTVSSNAEQLKSEILDILQKTGPQKVNLIAHSKGGLDSKKMITTLGMAEYVASLTTLCTPHKGSKMATNILRLPKWMLRIVNFWINLWYRIFGDKVPDAFTVCEELAAVDSIEELTVGISEAVYCQSFSTTLDRSRDDFVMGIPLVFSRRFEKSESDGLVAPESSVFANYRGKALDGSVSHTEIVDFMVRSKKREKIHTFYISLCAELEQMGF